MARHSAKSSQHTGSSKEVNVGNRDHLAIIQTRYGNSATGRARNFAHLNRMPRRLTPTHTLGRSRLRPTLLPIYPGNILATVGCCQHFVSTLRGSHENDIPRSKTYRRLMHPYQAVALNPEDIETARGLHGSSHQRV